MTAQFTQGFVLPHLYISGLDLSVASTTAIGIAPGYCRDSNNVMDITISETNFSKTIVKAPAFKGYSAAVFISSAQRGVNGLDTGTIAASTQYAVYAIGDSSGALPAGGLLSLAGQVAPVMPSGYDSLRLLGFISTNASANFVMSTNAPQVAKSAARFDLEPAVSVLSGGNATTFTAVNLGTAVPSTTLKNVIVTLQVTFIPAAANDVVQFRPVSSTMTANLPTIVGLEAGIAQTQYIEVVAAVASSTPRIEYLVSASGDSVSASVVSWTGLPTLAYPV